MCLVNAKGKQLNQITGQIQQEHTHTHTRRRVLCTLPPLDPAAATSQNCMGHKVDGLLHKTKEQTKTRIAIPPQPPQAKRTQTRERPSSALLPPRDPLLHPAMITPPCPIPEGQQPTPVELRSYMHVSETKNIYIRILYYLQIFCSLQDNKFINCILRCYLDYPFLFLQTPDLPDYLIPRLKMRFKDVEKAREFYNRYARHAGFGIRKTGGNDNHKYFVCAFQGIHTSSVSEANRKRNKTSQRTGCNARMRVKVQEDGTCVAVDIEYNHNHQLMQTDDMLVFLHSHKNYDPTILEYVKLLQYHDVKHTTIMSMLSENEDGSYFLSMTGRDLLNQ